MNDSSENHILFLQIINGYSPVYDKDIGEIYIKHLSKFELLNIENEYLKIFNNAKLNNLLTNKQREKQIIEDGLWSKKEEEDINNNQKLIEGIREQISQSFLISKRRIFRKEILDAEQRLRKLFTKKDYLIGQTAEKIASKHANLYRIKNCLYRDELFKEKIIQSEIDESEFNKLSDIYYKEINKINIDGIKNITLSSFFTSMYYLCDDNAYYFYGKPIITLTEYQINLMVYGKYFKGLMNQYGDKLPENMNSNPDDIIEWFEITRNVEKSGILNDDDENMSATSITGATKEDLSLMGIDKSQIIDIGAKISKSGKTMLDREDMYKMSN